MAEQADPQWVRSGWGHRVDSQDEAFRAIMRIVSLASNRQYVWRGSTDRRYRVRSSLLRELIVDESDPLPDEVLIRQNELAILREAREWSLAVEMGPLASDLYLLAHLQHHGLPTRLLDVTYNPMTALWFACEGKDDVGGVLFAFDVTSLPTYPTIDPQQRQTYGLQSEPLAWTLRYALRQSALNSQPFLVRPTVPDARMAAQEGLFLSGVVPMNHPVGGIDGLPIQLGPPPGREKLAVLFDEGRRRVGRPTKLPFCALVIPPELKKTIRNHLTALNRRRSVMYPDVDGFRDAYRGDHLDLDLDSVRPVVSAYDDVDAGAS
ncbi:FRG domain-containing protein [Klenkia sp. PcliD-1-E]|uniref:FRG domain-containing protein n=1 Tax=Klenkia sp. PcliD-1-E TaxID=2954492 RepID=UPI0020969CEF|nr:FRG domain-containing protein [Klenkia sp. PcliD-1-E]MCO7222474.1 FRG domain-containing protein [Klenkia sp. PcliD-1-E]